MSPRDTGAAAPAGPGLIEDHALLLRAVREGGRAAAGLFGKSQKSWEKRPGHPACEADIAVDRILREVLIGARPTDGWLSEESEDDSARLKSRRVWVVDPIDGTKTYLKGIPEFAVAASLTIEGRPAAAAVYNPATEELFEASLSGGARLNGAPIRVSETSALEGACLASSRTELKKKLWAARFPETRIEPIGSIAYKLALVAAGRFDGLISLRPKHEWDVAAGDLLIAEAGGRVTTAEGEPLRYNREHPRLPSCVASNGRIHRALLAALKAP